MQLKFTRRFCSAHRLMSNLSPKCQNPHGHNWEVVAVIEPTQSYMLDLNANMVVEFGAAKKKWHTWIDEYVDHSIMLNENDRQFIRLIREIVPHTRMMLVPGDPTTEITCALFKAKLNAILEEEHDGQLICTSITLVETPTNTVTFTGNENNQVPPGTHLPENEYEQFWWHRPDMSTFDERQVEFMETGTQS